MRADGRLEAARTVPIGEAAQMLGLLPSLRRQGGEFVGPCPCGRATRDGLQINTRKNVFLCRPSGIAGDAIALTQHVLDIGFREAVERLAGPRQATMPSRKPWPVVAEGDDSAERIAFARAMWARRKPLAGSPAETYLRHWRGLSGPFPAALAYLPASEGFRHSLIAPFAIAGEPEPGCVAVTQEAVTAVHLTRLLPDSSDKQPGGDNKITIGRPKGSPIVLAPPTDLLGLLITEGVEDALSLHEATGLGAWAAGSAPLMPHLADVVPTFIEAVTVVGDPDANGFRYARELAARLRARGHVDVSLKFLEGVP
jgi:hypothetical protein